MPQQHRIALAGCGGMGRRHLRSYRVLFEAEPGRAALAAVVDPEPERAEFVAAEAEQLLGSRPPAFASLEQAAAAVPELDVVDIVAAASAHHRITSVAADAGMHVLCEKPMAPTVAACRTMQHAAERAGRVLSVAENYRRDPISRLARALVAAGAIGELRSLVDLSGSGGNRGHAGPWRYRRTEGGPILEAGVHNADMQQYVAGAATRVSAQVRLNEPRRVYRDTPLKVFHDHYAHRNPEVAPADAPDMLMATVEYAGGALGQWLYDDSLHGPGLRRFTLFGSEGQIDLPGVRSGRPLRVFRDDHDDVLPDAAVLALVPDFALDERTARLFGGKRLARYENTGGGMGGSADLKLLAIEMAELLDVADADGGGPPVEVDAEVGLSAAALVLACHESSAVGRPVTLSEVIDGTLDTWQRPANRALGL
jgi:predicted dehydrogenase